MGAVIGAFLINLCEYNLSSGGLVEIWQYIIGIIFTVTVLFFKKGIVGSIEDFVAARKQKRIAGQTEQADAEKEVGQNA